MNAVSKSLSKWERAVVEEIVRRALDPWRTPRSYHNKKVEEGHAFILKACLVLVYRRERAPVERKLDPNRGS